VASPSRVTRKGISFSTAGAGDSHGNAVQSAKDVKRDGHFPDKGFQILRFWNVDVDQNLDGVVETVYRILTTDPTPALRADPPLTGEGGIVQ
jgi:hypothetical protein